VLFLSDFIPRLMSIGSIQRQSMIYLGSTIAFTVIGFISTIFFAHTLGPAPLGAYFLFMAYFGIFNLVADGGFGSAAVKRISEGKESNEYFSAFVFIRIIISAFAVSALLYLEPFFKDATASGIFFWVLLALVVSVFSGITGTGVYGTGKVGVYQLSGFLETSSRFVFQVAGVFLGFGIAGLTGGFIGGLIAGGIANFRYLDLKIIRFKFYHVKNLSSFSFWIFLTASGSLVFSYADTILIGFFMNDAAVGIYRTAFQLTSIATFTTLAFHTVLYPQISNWGIHQQLTKITNSLGRAFTYSLLLAIPTCIGGWILGEKLLYFFYGTSFTQGTSALYFLLVAQIVNVFMYLGTMCLTALDRPREAFWITATASIANIVLNIALIPVYGITGAAIATLLAMTMNAIGVLFLLSRIISIKFEYKSVKNILFAAIFMGILLLGINYFLPFTHVIILLAVVFIGAIIYTLVLFKLDHQIHDEIRQLCVNMGIFWPTWL
jgi:O-antigen/teichoic acid export membrane protein